MYYIMIASETVQGVLFQITLDDCNFILVFFGAVSEIKIICTRTTSVSYFLLRRPHHT